MPTYELKCNRCGKQFEISASFVEMEKASRCPQCDSLDVNQIYSANIFLKGARSSEECTGNCKGCDLQRWNR